MARRIDPSFIPPKPTLEFEKKLWAEGLSSVAGVDEAGRGALAGPVYAAAVILPTNKKMSRLLPGVRDSKEMSAKQRAHWAAKIRELADSWGVGRASAKKIDQFGIIPATQLAVMRALGALAVEADHILIDALRIPEHPTPQTMLIKGDMRSLTIAAGSVLAKVARDEELVSMDEEFPAYGFAQHKGYGTLAHRQAISKQGPSCQHRMSFAPMRFI